MFIIIGNVRNVGRIKMLTKINQVVYTVYAELSGVKVMKILHATEDSDTAYLEFTDKNGFDFNLSGSEEEMQEIIDMIMEIERKKYVATPGAIIPESIQVIPLGEVKSMDLFLVSLLAAFSLCCFTICRHNQKISTHQNNVSI